MKLDSMIDNAQVMAPSKLPSASRLKTDEQFKEAAKQFEQMFMNLVIKQMRENVPEGGLFEDSSKIKFWQGMLDEEYSKISAQDKPGSLSHLIYENLKHQLGAVGDLPKIEKTGRSS